MRCLACKKGSTEAGSVTISVDRGSIVIVVRDVPARICTTCGEEYLDAETMKQVEEIVDSAKDSGVDVSVKYYSAA